MSHKWKSIKFPSDIAEKIERIAKAEKRSFSSQALDIIERELEARENIESGNTQIDPSIIKRSK